MHEVRVESFEKLESREGRVLLWANAGSPSIIFPQEVLEDTLANAPTFDEPAPEELEELGSIRGLLEEISNEVTFGTCSREGSAGGKFMLLHPGDNLCHS